MQKNFFQNVFIFFTCFFITTFCFYLLGYLFGLIITPLFGHFICGNLIYTGIQIEDIPITIGTLEMIVFEPVTIISILLSLLRRRK